MRPFEDVNIKLCFWSAYRSGLLEKVSDRIRKIDEEEGLLLEWVIKNE